MEMNKLRLAVATCDREHRADSNSEGVSSSTCSVRSLAIFCIIAVSFGIPLSCASNGTITVSPRDAESGVQQTAQNNLEDASVVDVAVASSTGWMLTSGRDASVWQMTLGKAARNVIDHEKLAKFEQPTVQISPWNDLLFIAGMQCDSRDVNTDGACTTASGIVDVYRPNGDLVRTTALWRDRIVQAGGVGPTVLGASGGMLWLAGPDRIYAIAHGGTIRQSIPRASKTTPCLVGNELFSVSIATPVVGHDGVVSHSNNSADDNAENPAQVTLSKWNAGAWQEIPTATTASVGGAPELTCGSQQMTLWDNAKPTAILTVDNTWAPITTSISQNDGAVTGSDGVIYQLDSEGNLAHLDAQTGHLATTGLAFAFGSSNARVPMSVHVARDDSVVFACAGSLTGGPGLPDIPHTKCAFASASH